MSRTSDTRQRTREAAAQLVTAGKRPHEITVDLIYAEIQQGSRTTINDELKLWKDERTKIDALGADLPPPVADAMRAAWIAAVEHGEQVFDQQRETLEKQLAAAIVDKEAADAARQATELTVRELRQRLEVIERRSIELEQRLANEIEAKDAAQAKAFEQVELLSAVRADHVRAIDRLRQEQASRETTHQQQLAEREANFRNEIARATERLEGVQNHMLRQINEARDAQKHAETDSQSAKRRADQLQSAKRQLSAQCSVI